MEEYYVELEVRDYELDMHGIVNDSVYVQYLEHGRHKFLDHIGANFELMAEKDIFFTNAQTTVKYKLPLRGGETFRVTTSIARQGKIRFIFNQKVINSEGKICVEAEVIGVCLNKKGRPFAPDEIVELVEKNL
ncbi:MAG: acyl-CoA thioesterase [Nitrospinae bacterium]|nr:acyl-CoA thioesterase [Nitrospinota bacterium]